MPKPRRLREARMSDNRSPKDSLNDLYTTPVGQLLELDEIELRRLLAKAELIARWLRGALKLKAKKGTK